jgi:hypothetical protein
MLNPRNQRLTASDYALIRRMRAEGILNPVIARVVGCSEMHVGRVLRGKVVGALLGTPAVRKEQPGDAASTVQARSRV